MKPKQDEYVFYKELQYPEGKARVYRPTLSEAEYTKRMREIMSASWDFVVASERKKQQETLVSG